MKPRTLTLAGFGSFAQAQTISFDALEGFFLIRGETGSGKTTLFDALVWCLYGDLPGVRSGISPRSRLVGEDTLAYVDFSFAMGSQEVRVRREMEYLRAKKSGHGQTKEAASLSIWIQGKIQPGHSAEREDLIRRLIGLRKEEFAKVILLPQGEFEAFLMANSRERQDLLARIFPLDDYEEVTQKSMERSKEIKNSVELLERQMEQIQEANEGLEEQVLMDESRELKGRLQDFQDQSEALLVQETQLRDRIKTWEEQKRLLERRQSLKQAKGRIQELQAQLKKEGILDPLRTLWNKNQQVKKELERRQKILIQEEKDLQTWIQEQKAAEDQLAELPAWNRRLEEIALLKAGAQGQEGKRAKLLALREEHQSLGDQWKRLTKEKKVLQDRCEGLENRRQALRDEVRKIGDFLGAEAELAEEFITLSQKRDLAKTDARQRTELEKLRAQQGRVVRKDDLRQALTHRLLETQEPGDPCPVCGNRHWRAVQQGPEGEGAEFIDLDLAAKISLLEKSLAEEPLVFDQDRWDLLNRKRDEAKSQRVALDRSSSELQGLDHEAAEAQAALKDLELRMADVKSQGKAVAERISDFEEEDWSKLDLDLLEEEETQLRDQQTKLQRAAEEWSQKVQGQKIKTEERRQQLKREEEDYLKTESEIRQELLSGGLELEESLGELFNQRYDSHQARQEVESHQQAWQEVQTRLEGMKVSDHLEQENPRQKLQEVQVQLKEVRNNREIAQEAWAALQAKHQGLKDRLKKQKELLKQREELKEDLSQWELLSQTLAGQRGKKVRFSSFVLQFILQDILHLANQRLEGLSKGQFQFRLLSSNEDGRKKGGLDLMIYDSFCGEERRPQTLSGGEKFLASLALALGLSDGFTLRQGGRNLDALFIDEGFGTLDEEALDRALTVLDEIRSGRIIGLISHVRGLQERIPAVVQIRKTPEGSRIEHRVDRV